MCALATISREPDTLSIKRQTKAIWSLSNTPIEYVVRFLEILSLHRDCAKLDEVLLDQSVPVLR